MDKRRVEEGRRMRRGGSRVGERKVAIFMEEDGEREAMTLLVVHSSARKTERRGREEG